MAGLDRVRRRLRALTGRAALERELDEELSFHLEMEAEENVRQGLSLGSARTKALREFGGVARVKDDARDARGTRPFEELARDLRHAARSLRRAPGYTLVALLTLALGIGATTAVFAAVDGALLRPLPYAEPERLVRLFERTDRGDRGAMAAANFHDARRVARSLEALAFYGAGDATVLGADRPILTQGAYVSDDFFRVLGVPPLHGRTFARGERPASGARQTVISHRFWQTVLGGDPAWATRPLRVEDGTVQIVGIMPPGFGYPAGTDLWGLHEDDNPYRTAHNWSVVGRLAPGATAVQAAAELDAHFGRLKAELADEIDATGIAVLPLQEHLASGSRKTLLMLMGAVGLVLLIACVNLASANLARGESRQRELAVRAAIGAGRGRLVRQLLAENLLVVAIGGALGVALAWALLRALPALASSGMPPFAEPRLDLRVLAFAAGASLLTVLLVGVAPALRSTRDLRGAIGQGAGTGRRPVGRRALIAAEVAFAIALLVGAGLLVRSLRTILAVDTGFRSAGITTLDVTLPALIYGAADGSYGDTARIAAFYDRLLPQLRAIPGVRRVGVINQVPLGGGGMGSGFMVDGGTDGVGAADYRIVDPEYFATLGIPLLRGRGLGTDDRPGAPHATVINRAMAERYWPGTDPLGHTLRLPGMDRHRDDWLTIVGIVENVRHGGLDQEVEPAMFISYAQRPERLSRATIVVDGPPPAAIAATMRERVRELDPNVPVEVGTMAQLVDASVAGRRFSAMVLTSFAAVAAFLAAIGIYGVLAYSVAQRHREIGVRMALGAHRGRVRTMVLREAMTAVVPGVILGLLGALALTRFVRSMLFGVRETDPLTFATVPLLLLAVAVLASLVPAHRATRVDPLTAIRSE